MDVTQLNRHSGPIPQRQVISGYISTAQPAPTGFDQPVYVIAPGYSVDRPLGPCKFAAVHGATLPAQGAECLVTFDDRGVPIVVWWDGVYSAPNLDVRDFGADPTGVADSTAAIRAALTAGAGGSIFLPAGTYLVSGTLTVGGGTRISGAGHGASILKAANGMNADMIATADDHTPRYWIVLENFGIDGNAAHQTSGNAINLLAVSESRVEGLRISNPKQSAIRVAANSAGDTSIVPIIRGCILRGDTTNTTGSGIELQSNTSDAIVTSNDVGYFRQAAGILLAGHAGAVLGDCNTFQNRQGVQLFQGHRARISSVLADFNQRVGFLLQSSDDVQIANCQARESSQEGSNLYDGMMIDGCNRMAGVNTRAMGGWQRYGISVTSTAADTVKFANSILLNNLTGPYNVAAGPTNVSIA